MVEVRLPVLSGDAKLTYPADGKCPVCGQTFKAAGGVAYLSCGTLHIDSTGTMIDVDCASVETHFQIGFHGSDTEVRDSVNADIVDNLHWEQFDLNFCSLECLRTWFNSIIDSLSEELRIRKDAMK